MQIKNINLENMVLQAKKGIDIQEASGVNIKNVTLVTKETNPVAYVLNSSNILFDKIKFNTGAELLLQVQGERTGSIKLLNIDTSKAKKKLDVGFGAKEENVVFQ